MSVLDGFFDWLFGFLAALWDSLVAVFTFNPLAGLPSVANSDLIECVGWMDQYIPIRRFFQVLAMALPVFVLLVIAGIVWRWVRGL